MKRAALKMCAAATALGLAACGAHATPPASLPQSTPSLRQPMDVIGGPTGARLNVLLGDAAPDFGGAKLERFDLAIKEIDAIENGQTTVLASYDQPRVVNVLAHQDNSGESIADANVSRTDYQQLRIVVDVASSFAKFAGAPREPINFLTNVATSSSSGAGASTLTTADGPGAVDMLVSQPFSIPANQTNLVRVDFNAFESLAIDASGNLLARPALFVAPHDQMGRVTGRILDSAGNPVSNATVVAVAADGSIGNSDWTNSKGRFDIGTLRAGTYQLEIYNNYTTAAGREVDASGESSSNPSFSGPAVTVTGGQTTFTGVITD